MSEAFESQLSELLRRLNQARQVRILEPIASMTGRVLENNPVFHWMLIFAALLLVICVYAEIKQLTLFSLHPVCMSIGVLVFLAEGAVSFKNRVLFEFFSPIMQVSCIVYCILYIVYPLLHSSNFFSTYLFPLLRLSLLAFSTGQGESST